MENEQASPFPAFETLNSDPPAENKTKKKKGRPAGKTKPPNGRKRKRKVPVEKQPRSSSLDLQTAITAFAGLNAEACALVGELVVRLQAMKVPKRVRAQIVAALGKVFA